MGLIGQNTEDGCISHLAASHKESTWRVFNLIPLFLPFFYPNYADEENSYKLIQWNQLLI